MKEIELKGLNEKIYYDELNNGLKVYLWVNNKVNTYYATLSVKYGSIYKEFKVGKKKFDMPYGLAHFLEHVKFNEKKDVTANDFFDKYGSDTNAFTTFNYTNYQVYGSNNPKENIAHLLDFVQNKYFTNKMINDEKGIIIEEANSTLDNPYSNIYFKLLSNIFNSYENRTIITGEKDDIKKISLNDVETVFDNFYHPKNMFLVITGNFNPYEIMECIKENQDKKEFIKYNNPERIIKKEKSIVNIPYEEVSLNVSSRKIRIGIKINKKDLKSYDDLHIRIYLSLLLKANFGSTSDFKDEIINKEIANNIMYNYEFFDDYIIIIFSIDSEYKDEILNRYNNKLNNLVVDKKTFDRMKKSEIASLILEFEDVEYVNNVIQTEILNYGKIINNLKEIYESIRYEEIEDFIKLINLKEKSILIINPN